MKPSVTKFLVFIFLGLFAAMSNAQSATPVSRTNLPDFPYQQGWLGADDAYSVPLTATRSLWFFADSFVAGPTTTQRSQFKAMVRNSVGISDCATAKPCTMNYFWSHQETSHPRSFFDSGKDDLWYWPLDGFRDGNTLYLALTIVRNRPDMKPNDPFGFEIAGTSWVTIDNVFDPPPLWHMQQKDITGDNLWAAVSMVADGDFVLFYSQLHQHGRKDAMCVQRVPRSSLADPAKSWEYLAKNGSWRKGNPGPDAKIVIDQPIAEMTVRYHPARRKWVAVSIGPEFPSKRVVVREAKSALGPWSAPKTVFEFPEMKSSFKSYDKDTFCYAAKEHIEFDEASIILTYVCNSFSLHAAVRNMDIYRPALVKLDIP